MTHYTLDCCYSNLGIRRLTKGRFKEGRDTIRRKGRFQFGPYTAGIFSQFSDGDVTIKATEMTFSFTII